MRRLDRAVTNPEEIADMMARCEILRLALNTDTVPYILPVNFGMEPDGMTLYIHGAKEGTKYAHIARDNRASFQMDCCCGIDMDPDARECSMAYESVIGWGILREVLDPEEEKYALDRLMAQYHQEAFDYNDAYIPATRVFRLDVQERTAKRRRKVM